MAGHSDRFIVALLFEGRAAERRPARSQALRLYAGRGGTECRKKHRLDFYFFDASDGQQFVEERIDIPSGTEEDYRNANLTVLRMLLRDNEFPLTDGTSVVPLVVDRNEAVEGNKYVLVMPDYRHPDTWDPYRSHHSIRVEPGKYYVVALFGDYHDRWPCQQKYTGKVPDCCGSRHAFSHSDGRFSQRSDL